MNKFCQSCGTELGEGKFCHGCGAAIGPAPKKSPALRIGCLVLIAVAAVLLILSALLSNSPQTSAAEVTYEVTDPYDLAMAQLTYRNESGGTEQKTVSLPWTLKLRPKRGTFLYLSAQKSQRSDYDTIQATIYVDGHAIQTARSNSLYGIASVSGTVP